MEHQHFHHFIVDPNGSTQQRSATITFSNTEKGLSQSLTVNQKGAREEGSIHILAIGNSFSVDAMEYLCQILIQAGYKSVKLGNLYIGGCTLKTHAENLANGFKAYTYYTTTNGTWSSCHQERILGLYLDAAGKRSLRNAGQLRATSWHVGLNGPATCTGGNLDVAHDLGISVDIHPFGIP